MTRAALLALASLAVAPRLARADEGPPRVDLGASLGWAAPAGSAERGARTSDTTTGVVPLRVDAAYALAPTVGVAVAFAYAPAIPTLCATASDCAASVGSDVSLSLRARFFLPRIGPTAPRLDAGVGYEWLTTRLADGGARSTRAYEGPLLALLEATAPFRMGSHWTIGPVAGAALGVYAAESLETDAFTRRATVADRAAHAWLFLGLRVGFEAR